MELHKAIKEIVANKGAEMIGNIQIINYLLDYQAFKDKPATKLILRAIIDSGYAENILSLINTTGWETKFKQYQHELIDSCGFKENLTQYVFNSIAYALSLIEVEEELMPSDSEDNSDADNFVNENKNKTKIIQVLDAFKIGYDEIRVTCGPQVTSFEFYPEIGVKLSKIKNLRNEFTAALASGDINIVAPTDKGMVCIEVPNKDRQIIPILDFIGVR